jgi:hypothetical protein
MPTGTYLGNKQRALIRTVVSRDWEMLALPKTEYKDFQQGHSSPCPMITLTTEKDRGRSPHFIGCETGQNEGNYSLWVSTLELRQRHSFMFFFFCFFETGSHCVTQAGLELEILLPQTPECWDYIMLNSTYVLPLFFFPPVFRVELRALHLLDRCSIT